MWKAIGDDVTESGICSFSILLLLSLSLHFQPVKQRATTRRRSAVRKKKAIDSHQGDDATHTLFLSFFHVSSPSAARRSSRINNSVLFTLARLLLLLEKETGIRRYDAVPTSLLSKSCWVRTRSSRVTSRERVVASLQAIFLPNSFPLLLLLFLFHHYIFPFARAPWSSNGANVRNVVRLVRSPPDVVFSSNIDLPPRDKKRTKDKKFSHPLKVLAWWCWALKSPTDTWRHIACWEEQMDTTFFCLWTDNRDSRRPSN